MAFEQSMDIDTRAVIVPFCTNGFGTYIARAGGAEEAEASKHISLNWTSNWDREARARIGERIGRQRACATCPYVSLRVYLREEKREKRK